MEEQTQSASKSQLEPSYADPALEKIRAAVRGNGVKPDSIKVKKIEGEVAEFTARTLLVLRTRTMERVQGGKKTAGEKVDNAQGVRDAIERERLRILGSQDITARIKDTVLERKDKGFGTRNEIIKLPFLTKEYVYHQACKNCNAQGQIKCQRCAGKGHELCPRCNGQSMEICTQCRGAQLIFNGNAKVPCPKCNGQGRTPCMMCRQTRKIPCSVCKTKGSTTCQTCNGQAWHSYITTAEADVIANFSLDQSGVPHKLLPVIVPHIREIPQYADITVLFTQEQAAEQKSDEFPLNYRVNMPYAETEFSLGPGRGSLHAFLIGRTAEIASIPDFLEPLIRNGIDTLQDAAEGRGNVANKIHRAARYRVVRQAILASVRYSNAKAVKFVAKSTPLGISEAMIKKLVTYSEEAMQKITAKPRRNGVIVGNLLAGIFFLAYMMGGLRLYLANYVPDEQLRIFMDGGALASGMLLAAITIQIFNAFAIRKAIGKLLPPGQKAAFISKAGQSGLWSALLCTIMFIGIAELSTQMQGMTPEWYSVIRARLS